MDEIKLKIKDFLAKFYRKGNIEDNDNIFELGFTNSLFAMQLVMFLEKEFFIKLENEDINMDNFKTINSIYLLVESKTK